LQNYVCVLLLRSSEEYQLIMIAQSCKHLHEIRPEFYINL
jgi:hypothetical protein